MSYVVEKIAAGQSELPEPFASLLKGGKDAFFALCEQVRAGLGEKVAKIEFNIKAESSDNGWGSSGTIRFVDGATPYLKI